jgi:hypothetical protein
MIGKFFTSGGTGTVTGWSRFVFSAGCATGPVVSLTLYRIANWAPWPMLAVCHILTLFMYLVCGISLLKEPEWHKN